jgi:hypothetical protein
VTAYLVQYGRSAFVGRFRSAEAVAFARGDRVVVRGPRGLELGTVLCEPAAHVSGAADPDGDLLRHSTAEDDAAAARHDALGRDVLAAADASGLPIAFVDIEVSLDGIAAVLHGLPWGGCDATPLFEQLSERFGLAVRLLDLSHAPTANDPPDPATAGCGKPGCGSEGGGCSTGSCGTGGGCSTGSCSRGKVKSAADLTAYFADLRQKMEELSQTRTPLA